MIPETDLRLLTSGRWLLPVMALVAAEGGTRFAVLLAQLGLSRSALSASLVQLQEAGWLARNPGHGHPLRPEYVLAPAGEPIALFCAKVMEQRTRLALEPDLLSRWSLPIAARLDRGSARFSALQSALSPITPRALSLSLKQMLAADIVERSLQDRFPPIAIYGLTPRGRDLAAAMR